MVNQGVAWVQGALLLHLSTMGVTSLRVGTGRRVSLPPNVYNRPGTPPPAPTSASSVGAVARPLRRTRCQSLPSDLDFGAVPDDDEEDDDVSSVLGDDDEAMDDDDEDDGDADDDDGADDDGAEKEGLWQERRLSKKEMRERKAMAVRAKLTWEEKYEDDPLRSDTPAKDFVVEEDWYQRTYVAVGDVADPSLRQEAWVHHMQWARRSALLPAPDAKVKWEYTRLTADCMGPAGQVLCVRANTTDAARAFLDAEPLKIFGGVREWQLYEFHAYTHGNTTNPLHDPKMFLGFRDGPADTDTDAAAEDTLLGEHRRYHVTGGAAEGAVPRVALMGQLAPADAATPALRGTLVLFNARTGAEAERYMAADPLAQVCPPARRSVSVVNEQDVDGLHHLMARTFGEKTVLDQVHFMDPEDLLEMTVPELPGLESHRKANRDALRMLDDANLVYRYTRLGLNERYGSTKVEQAAKEFNKAVEQSQKVRMAPVVDGIEMDEDAVIASTSEDFSAGAGADD